MPLATSLPMKRHGRLRRPLETEGERDAWLPPSHPYPEISSMLRVIVVGVLALAGEEAEIFLAAHRIADHARRHGRAFAMASAPAFIAFTML